ncbi:VanZ family protein [Actinoplanes aureus]|jgi:glycopeptide antibiotics resistance protein|uniref:VanZ family protein n=1 Tax=Actinoplanes aureus TaxID=2792083 RepID=A0A931C3B8_9ACTN|nr:VanZ family protein [Actinoplanes aureus]MBG0562614.1 VanZ family protein [Actinoplanes aureus]
MPFHQFTVPALPVLLPLGFTLMVLAAVLLHRRGLLTPSRLGVAWLAGWYAVAVFGATMLPMRLAWGPGAGYFEPGRLVLEPVVGMRPLDFMLNIAMTVPLAAVLHVSFGVRDVRRVVLCGFLLSLTIESVQAILAVTLHGDRWADVNDLMSNTLGAYFGYLAFRRLMRFARFRRAVENCSFARTGRDTPAAVR